MHTGCLLSLMTAKEKYPDAFYQTRILELGSHDPSLAIRQMFDEPQEYVGVDAFVTYGYLHNEEKAKQYGVDLICNARETKFAKEYFDTLVCASMFEHDTQWFESLEHNLPFLKKGGFLFLEWGAEGNQQHDSTWQPVTTEEFFERIATLPIKVLDSFFEEDRYHQGDCPGAYVVYAIKK